MNTDDLIAKLSQDVPRVARHAVGWRLVTGLVLGAVVALAAVALGLGIRPDLGLAMRSFAFWMKWTYTISLTIAALAVTVQLARPDSGRLRWVWTLAVPVVLLAAIGVVELTAVTQRINQERAAGVITFLTSGLTYLAIAFAATKVGGLLERRLEFMGRGRA